MQRLIFDLPTGLFLKKDLTDGLLQNASTLKGLLRREEVLMKLSKLSKILLRQYPPFWRIWVNQKRSLISQLSRGNKQGSRRYPRDPRGEGGCLAKRSYLENIEERRETYKLDSKS